MNLGLEKSCVLRSGSRQRDFTKLCLASEVDVEVDVGEPMDSIRNNPWLYRGLKISFMLQESL